MAAANSNQVKEYIKAVNKSTRLPMLEDNYLYISNLDEDFQFWRLPCTPDSISDSMASTFSESNALGRSAPVYTYSKSGPRTVQIELKLHRDMMDDINVGVSNANVRLGEDYIDSLVRALQAIVVPKYNLSNKAVEPPVVALRLSKEVFIKGIVNDSIGITYKLPILSNGKYAQISLSLKITEVDPYDASTVFTNGSFRGVVKTLKNGMNIMDE
jgi:hypothetical protein